MNRVSPLCRWLLPAFLLLSFVVLWDPAAAQDPPADGDPAAATVGDSEPATKIAADAGSDATDADDPQAKPADEPAAPIKSEKDAEVALQKAAKEAGETAKQAADALKSGDLATAAAKSGELFTKYGVPAIVALVVLIIAYFVASFLGRLASTPIRKRVDETLGRFVGKMIFYLVMVCAVLGVMQYFGIGTASFAAVLAAAGFAVGLAFQGTLSNFSAGIMLLVFRPFRVGDVINAAGITAKVNEIALFTTVFDTPDNRRIIVPNSAIASGTIENISHHSERRVDVSVGVDYTASLDQTREVLTSAVDSLKEKLIEGEGRGYQIVLTDLGQSSVNWTIRFWTRAADFWPVKEQLTYNVKTKLDEAGIGIPFPQLDIHMISQAP